MHNFPVKTGISFCIICRKEKMRKKKFFILPRVFLLFLLTVQCDNPFEFNNPLKINKVTIEDVWLQDCIDEDNDGYYSGCKVYYDLDCNDYKIKVYSWFGFKKASAPESESYRALFISKDFYVNSIYYFL